MKNVLKSVIPDAWWAWMRNRRPLRFGSFARVTPISFNYGMDRGTPIDRFYIERFLEQHAQDIRGHVLEFADDSYIRRFGGNRATARSVWHSTADNPHATIVGDLARADDVASDQFDCIICTQVLMYVYDVRQAIRTLHRVLKPGGTLLITLPGIAPVTRYDNQRWGDYWRFTALSLARLLCEAFENDEIAVESQGNVLAAMAILHGLSQKDVRRSDLEKKDSDYQCIITARAVKAARVEPPVIETQPTSRTKSHSQ